MEGGEDTDVVEIKMEADAFDMDMRPVSVCDVIDAIVKSEPICLDDEKDPDTGQAAEVKIEFKPEEQDFSLSQMSVLDKDITSMSSREKRIEVDADGSSKKSVEGLRRSNRIPKLKHSHTDTCEFSCNELSSEPEYEDTESEDEEIWIKNRKRSAAAPSTTVKKKRGRPKKKMSESVLVRSREENKKPLIIESMNKQDGSKAKMGMSVLPSESSDSIRGNVNNRKKAEKQLKCESENNRNIKAYAVCSDCGWTFWSERSHTRHKLTCKSMKATENRSIEVNQSSSRAKHVCPICHLTRTTRNSVKVHISSSHSHLMHITCVLCNIKIGGITQARRHACTEHRIQSVCKALECPICGMGFSEQNKSYRDIHIVNVHANMFCVSCALCQRSVGSMIDYFQHFHYYHVNDNGIGSKCGTDVSVSPQLLDKQNSKKTVATQEEYVCLVCKKNLDNYKLLVLHTLSHKVQDNLSLACQDLATLSQKQSVQNPVSDNDLINFHEDFLSLFPTEPETTAVPDYGGLSILSTDLLMQLHHSCQAMANLSGKLSKHLDLNEQSCPKTKVGLIQRMNEILRMSSGITDICKCLLLVLEESKQIKSKYAYSDDEESHRDDIIKEDSNITAHSPDNNQDSVSDQNVGLKSLSSSLLSSSGSGITEKVEENCSEGEDGSIKLVGKETDIAKENSSDDKDQPVKQDLSASQTNVNVRASGNSKAKAVKRKSSNSGQAKLGSNPKLLCKLCGKLFQYAHQLKSHRSICHDFPQALNRPFQCDVCKKKYVSEKQMTIHLTRYHPDIGCSNFNLDYKCDFCDYTSQTLGELLEHVIIHKKALFFSCQDCEATYRTSHELANHNASVHLPQRCRICGYIAQDAKDLEGHQASSHPIYKCSQSPKCGFSSHSKDNVRRHEERQHVEAKFCCEQCGASFTRFIRLQYHVTRHANKTPFSCPHCDFKCSSKASYQYHLLKHTGLRPCVCKLCGADFPRSQALKKHMAVHSHEKPFACSICGKSFKASSNCREHERTHSTETRHVCPVCLKGFARKKYLERHELTHLKQKKKKS